MTHGEETSKTSYCNELISQEVTHLLQILLDLDIVKELTQVANSQNRKLELSYARDVHVDDFKEANVILIGAAIANPWVELFEPRMNFVFVDAHIRQYTVLNRTPTLSEPRKWTSNYDDPQHRVYGVVGFLLNLGGTGSVLILEDTSETLDLNLPLPSGGYASPVQGFF